MNAPAKTEELAATVPAGVYAETVTSVQHYTDRLFRFRMTRPDGFRFRSGEFAMIGLMVDGKPVYRAYSIASPAWDEELEFFSIKVPDGPLTSHLQQIKQGVKKPCKQLKPAHAPCFLSIYQRPDHQLNSSPVRDQQDEQHQRQFGVENQFARVLQPAWDP